MTVRLLLLKSGEDIIADVKEMLVGTEEDPKVVGYFLQKPCIVKMTPPSNGSEKIDETTSEQRASFRITLFPWMPLSKDNVIPVSTDWVVTMVTPSDKLNKMYLEDVLNYGKENNKDTSTDERFDSDQSD